MDRRLIFSSGVNALWNSSNAASSAVLPGDNLERQSSARRQLAAYVKTKKTLHIKAHLKQLATDALDLKTKQSSATMLDLAFWYHVEKCVKRNYLDVLLPMMLHTYIARQQERYSPCR